MKTELNLNALKQQFALHLEALKNLTPQGLAEITGFIISLGDLINNLAAKPYKTDEDIERMELLAGEVRSFIGKLSEALVIMRKTEWKNTEAYYEELKEAAATGDPVSIQVFRDFEPVYFEMQERMKSQSDSSPFPVSSI